MTGSWVPVWACERVEHRRRLFAPAACCTRCQVSDVVVLVLGSQPLICRRCELFARTGRTTELHHLGGRPSTVVIEVDANIHAWLSLYQDGWRGRLQPGSTSAVLLDLLTLFVFQMEGIGGEAA